MPKYNISWTHVVKQEWIGTVIADSKEEAVEKLHNGDVGDEELMNEEGIEITDEHAEEE